MKRNDVYAGVHADLLLKSMDILQEVEDRTGAPGLSAARVVAVGSVPVGKLRETGPRIALDMTTRNQQSGMKVV